AAGTGSFAHRVACSWPDRSMEVFLALVACADHEHQLRRADIKAQDVASPSERAGTRRRRARPPRRSRSGLHAGRAIAPGVHFSFFGSFVFGTPAFPTSGTSTSC